MHIIAAKGVFSGGGGFEVVQEAGRISRGFRNVSGTGSLSEVFSKSPIKSARKFFHLVLFESVKSFQFLNRTEILKQKVRLHVVKYVSASGGKPPDPHHH